jgi:hypothetical protein
VTLDGEGITPFLAGGNQVGRYSVRFTVKTGFGPPNIAEEIHDSTNCGSP